MTYPTASAGGAVVVVGCAWGAGINQRSVLVCLLVPKEAAGVEAVVVDPGWEWRNLNVEHVLD